MTALSQGFSVSFTNDYTRSEKNTSNRWYIEEIHAKRWTSPKKLSAPLASEKKNPYTIQFFHPHHSKVKWSTLYVDLTKLFTWIGMLRIGALWQLWVFMFYRENCGLCALEQLTTIPQQGKWSLKQELKTVYIIIIIIIIITLFNEGDTLQ